MVVPARRFIGQRLTMAFFFLFFFSWWGWQPYAFHHVMRSLFVTLRLAATARQLEFITDLDQSIDWVRVHFFLYAVFPFHVRAMRALVGRTCNMLVMLTARRCAGRAPRRVHGAGARSGAHRGAARGQPGRGGDRRRGRDAADADRDEPRE